MNFGFVHLAAARPAVSNDRNWPGPGSRWGSRKLTSVGSVIASEVRFLTPPRSHAAGQLLQFRLAGLTTELD